MKSPSTYLFTGIACLFAAAFAQSRVEPVHVQEVRVIEVVDGDTYVVEPIATRIKLRLANADTWESRRVRRLGEGAISDEELAKGQAAKRAVDELLRSGRVFVETRPGKNREPVHADSFGRPLALVRVESGGKVIDVGEWLKEQGHTRQ